MNTSLLPFALSLAMQTDPPPESKSLLQHVISGGPIGFVIIMLSFVLVLLAGMHAFQIRRSRLAPPTVVSGLDRLLATGDLVGARAFCKVEDNTSFLTRVFDSALTRCSRSAFGMLELRSALEEAGQEETSKLYRSVEGIGLIATISPMLGLLGTVVGMVGAFEKISTSVGFAKPPELAGSISVALITTVLGLLVAIPATFIHTHFKNRIDALAAEVGTITEELTAHLDARAAQQRAGQPAQNGPRPAQTRQAQPQQMPQRPTQQQMPGAQQGLPR